MAPSRWIPLLALILNVSGKGLASEAAAQERVDCSVTPENKCDFVCDCHDCSDEHDCGFQGRDFVCDFEDEGMCGWVDESKEGYAWQRRQSGRELEESGPSSDYTTGTSAGWFAAVTAVTSDSPRTAALASPTINPTSVTCRVRLRYFLWDAGHTGLGDAPLWMSVQQSDGASAVVWRPETTSVRGWREAVVFLGRIQVPFQIKLQSRRSDGKRGDVAIDDMEFLDCALPVPPEGGMCSSGHLQCRRGGCVEENVKCDGTDDCGDGTDEEDCEGFSSCSFEDGLCGWDLTTFSSLKFVRTNQRNFSVSEPYRGPGRDHSNNTDSGHFLYVTKPDILKADWTYFQSPRFEPTSNEAPCRMVMYTHQFGRVPKGLAVLVAGESIYPVWERGGALGDLWVKAEVDFVVDSTFHILFVASIRDQDYGGIAIDDIVLSPECVVTTEPLPKPSIPSSPPHACTEESRICDFQEDCANGEDEDQCGDFSSKKGSSGWTDTSVGSQAWRLQPRNNDTDTDEFLFVSQAPGQQRTEAQTRTPLLGPSGPACTLQFSFSLSGSSSHIGELGLYALDGVMGTLPALWEFAGKTGDGTGSWRTESVNIGAREHRFQLEFRARAQDLSTSQIAVKDVHFLHCSAQFIPSADLSCNFEVDLCGWYQDQTDNYNWKLLRGMDHTVHDGQSLVVDMWDPSLRGLSGRLLSIRQGALSTQHCLSFFYKLYGPNTGALSVKLLFADDSEELLWMRSGSHGNVWHQGHCPLPPQLIAYQLVFEATRSGFDGRLALDDVALVTGSCSLPTLCSFESQTCGYNSSGALKWSHQSWAFARTGPTIDHSLETENGFYMMVYCGAEILPKGSRTFLTSPARGGLGRPECVHFWYHTAGEQPGTLNVYMMPSDGAKIKIFSSSLAQGDVWRQGHGNISWDGDWQLQFEVTGGGSRGSYIAIDDITYSTHRCPVRDSVCEFEKGLCGWSNTLNSSVDFLDWDLSSTQAETFYSRPPYDHTLHTQEGHFLLLPNSQRDTASQNAWMLSPHLPPTKGTCLGFWVYQSSSLDSKLTVWRLSEDAQHELVSLENSGGAWKYLNVSITSESEYQIVLEGFKGQKGVLALDDVRYTVGFSCAGKKTDSNSSSNNKAAVTAAIVFLVLLLVILAGLVVYYLKTRSSVAVPILSENFSNALYEPEETTS